MTTITRAVQLGQVVCTMSINELIATDSNFNQFVINSLRRHTSCDWGDLCDEDNAANDLALQGKGRLVSSYNIPGTVMTDHKKVWIITEWDRSATTILFPNEY